MLQYRCQSSNHTSLILLLCFFLYFSAHIFVHMFHNQYLFLRFFNQFKCKSDVYSLSQSWLGGGGGVGTGCGLLWQRGLLFYSLQ